MIDRLFYATALVASAAVFALATAEQVQVMADNTSTQAVQPAAKPQVVQLQRVVIRATAADRVAASEAADRGVRFN
jgi:hypothetical protein